MSNRQESPMILLSNGDTDGNLVPCQWDSMTLRVSCPDTRVQGVVAGRKENEREAVMEG